MKQRLQLTRISLLAAINNLLEFCKRHGFSPKKIRTASTIEDIVLMVESGLGYTVLDENCKSRHNSSLICVNSNDDVKLAALAIWRKDNYNPAISLFIPNSFNEQPIRWYKNFCELE